MGLVGDTWTVVAFPKVKPVFCRYLLEPCAWALLSSGETPRSSEVGVPALLIFDVRDCGLLYYTKRWLLISMGKTLEVELPPLLDGLE